MPSVPAPPLRATLMDVLPVGARLLLSVQGLTRRPTLPTLAVIVQTGERVRLLDQPASPTMWLLSEVTLLAEPLEKVNWREWRGKVLEIVEPDMG